LGTHHSRASRFPPPPKQASRAPRYPPARLTLKARQFPAPVIRPTKARQFPAPATPISLKQPQSSSPVPVLRRLRADHFLPASRRSKAHRFPVPATPTFSRDRCRPVPPAFMAANPSRVSPVRPGIRNQGVQTSPAASPANPVDNPLVNLGISRASNPV